MRVSRSARPKIPFGVGVGVGVGVVFAVGTLVAGRRRRRAAAAPTSTPTPTPAPAPAPPPRGDHVGWHLTPLASLDLETTGVDPLTDRVLSYALLGDDGTDVVGLVDPGVEIPPASSAVHGMTAETVAGAPTPATAIAVVIDWVSDLVERGVGLVVFNAAFDLTMLRVEAGRWGVAQPDWDALLVVDPFVIDEGIERDGPRRRGPRRLGDVSAYYGVTLDNAHDAGADARAAREVAVEIGRRHSSVAAGTLHDLMARERAWFAERADDWNTYARTVGRSLDDPLGWPQARVSPQTAPLHAEPPLTPQTSR